MLRSAATPNRTEVQSIPVMKQAKIRSILPTPTVSVRSRCAPAAMKIRPKLTFRVRLFKD
jgi:hypothetical protein